MTHSADWDCHCQSLSTVRLSGPVDHPRTPRTPRCPYMKNQNHKNVGDQRGDADEKSLRSHTPLTPLLLHGTTVSPRQHTPACGPRPRTCSQVAAAMLRSSTAEGGAVAAPPGAQLAASGGCRGQGRPLALAIFLLGVERARGLADSRACRLAGCVGTRRVP